MPTPSPRLRPYVPLALAILAMVLLGCNRDQVSRSTPAPAGPAVPAAAPAAPGAMPGQMPPAMNAQVPPPPAPSNPMKWSVPKGWTETAGSGMRFATLNPPPAQGKAEVSVTCLPGLAGGELPNVNRWRGQIGLEPLDEAALAKARQQVKSQAGAVAVFDFTGPGTAQTRMITGILVAKDGNTWFFKLMGDAGPVGKARPEFLRFLETLHLA